MMNPLPDSTEERIAALWDLCDPRYGDEQSKEFNFFVATKLQSAYTHRDAQPFEEEQMKQHGKITIFAETFSFTEEEWDVLCDYAVSLARKEIISGVLARRGALDAIMKAKVIPADVSRLTDLIEDLSEAFRNHIPSVENDDDYPGVKLIDSIEDPALSHKISEAVYEHASYFGNLARGIRYEMKARWAEPMDEDMAEAFASHSISKATDATRRLQDA